MNFSLYFISVSRVAYTSGIHTFFKKNVVVLKIFLVVNDGNQLKLV